MNQMRMSLVSSALFAAFLPTAALADAPSEGAGVGIFTGILMGLAANPEVLALLVSFVVGGLIALLRNWWKEKTDARLQWAANAISVAYYTVNDIAIRTPNTLDDKVAKALQLFRDGMARHGYKATATEEETAKAQWQAMHGAELTAAKLAVQGAGAVASTAALAAVTALPMKGSTPGPS